MIMTSDFWQSVISDDTIEYNPSWESVDAAISKLDGEAYTLVVLDNEKDASLFIGGGQSGLVVAWSSGEQNLVARQGEENEAVSIVVGGQVGDYKRKNVISIEQAKKIALAYFKDLDVKDFGFWDRE